MTDNKYWIFLEKLRRSGRTNMFEATPFLEKYFGIGFDEAKAILADWMKNYNAADYIGVEGNGEEFLSRKAW